MLKEIIDKTLMKTIPVVGKKIINHRSPVQTEKFLPSGQRKMLELGKPRSRHFPFTLGLGFLCLHQRPMTDSIWPCAKRDRVCCTDLIPSQVLKNDTYVSFLYILSYV